MNRFWLPGAVLGGLCMLGLTPGVAFAADSSAPLTISHAWAPAPEKVGADTALFMTIVNSGNSADSLLRVRCPFVVSAVKVTVDRGEGAPATREVKAIPIPAGQTLTMTPDLWHVQLLQTTEAVKPGQTVTCTLAFDKAGSQSVDVAIAAPGAKAAP